MSSRRRSKRHLSNEGVCGNETPVKKQCLQCTEEGVNNSLFVTPSSMKGQTITKSLLKKPNNFSAGSSSLASVHFKRTVTIQEFKSSEAVTSIPNEEQCRDEDQSLEEEDQEEEIEPKVLKYKDEELEESGEEEGLCNIDNGFVVDLLLSNAKFKVNKQGLGVIRKFVEKFLERAGEDLMAYAKHAGRHTATVEDAVLLLKRQRIIKSHDDLEKVMEVYLEEQHIDEIKQCLN